MASGLTPIVYEGEVEEIVGRVVAEHGLREIMLVTDVGVKAAGHTVLVRTSLEQAGIVVREYDRVRSNPTDHDVQACAAESDGVDGFVAVGGGSCIDTAKGASFIVTNGGTMPDYRGFGLATEPLLPIVAVPTTAGTGSEAQSYTLISDDETHTKMACGAMGAMPIAAILDARLTLTMPRQQTAITGLDAIVHAVESAVCTKRTETSWALSSEAFILLSLNLPVVLAAPDDLQARRNMLRGAMLAGQAIEASMLGAAHACANPLTAQFDVPHGVAVATMLPHVIRYNTVDDETAALYAALSEPLGGGPLDQHIERLLGISEIKHLQHFGVGTEAVDALVAAAVEQWTGQFNPRPVDRDAFAALYQVVLSG
jgi:alcohol dehydrogenase